MRLSPGGASKPVSTWNSNPRHSSEDSNRSAASSRLTLCCQNALRYFGIRKTESPNALRSSASASIVSRREIQQGPDAGGGLGRSYCASVLPPTPHGRPKRSRDRGARERWEKWEKLKRVHHVDVAPLAGRFAVHDGSSSARLMRAWCPEKWIPKVGRVGRVTQDSERGALVGVCRCAC